MKFDTGQQGQYKTCTDNSYLTNCWVVVISLAVTGWHDLFTSGAIFSHTAVADIVTWGMAHFCQVSFCTVPTELDLCV